MKWKTTELDKRCEGNSLFKSKDCNKAKSMLETFHEMYENFVKIGNSETVESLEHLSFIRLLHQNIVSTDKTNKVIRKLSSLKPPGKSIKDMFLKSPTQVSFLPPF